MIKPPRLKEGDRIAIVSASGGAARAFPHILKGGIDVLERRFGLRAVAYPTTAMTREELHGDPEKRAEDINRAFKDPNIAGIISSIGGNDSIRILKYLDLEMIMEHPKFIMGYSDSTSYLAFLNMHGLVTFYGPSVMAGLAYLENFEEAVLENREMLFERRDYSLRAFPRWAEEYRSWSDERNTGEVTAIHSSETGHQWINTGVAASGKLWGGCLETLEMMNGSFAWPDAAFFEDTVLFLETSEEKPTPEHVGCFLRNLGMQGILGNIQGLLIAKPQRYSDDEKAALRENVRMVVVDEYGRRDLNIIMNLDFGHTEPRHILPYGVDLLLDPEKEEIRFIEEIFS